jgi:hypothetical protein
MNPSSGIYSKRGIRALEASAPKSEFRTRIRILLHWLLPKKKGKGLKDSHPHMMAESVSKQVQSDMDLWPVKMLEVERSRNPVG